MCVLCIVFVILFESDSSRKRGVVSSTPDSEFWDPRPVLGPGLIIVLYRVIYGPHAAWKLLWALDKTQEFAEFQRVLIQTKTPGCFCRSPREASQKPSGTRSFPLVQSLVPSPNKLQYEKAHI